LVIFTVFRYERELYPTLQSSVRQGMVYGLFSGWFSLINYVTYAVAFICGSFLNSSKDHHTMAITDILIVSNSYNQPIRKCIYDYSVNSGQFPVCTMFEILQSHWSFLTIIFRSSRCSSIGLLTYWWGKSQYIEVSYR